MFAYTYFRMFVYAVGGGDQEARASEGAQAAVVPRRAPPGLRAAPNPRCLRPGHNILRDTQQRTQLRRSTAQQQSAGSQVGRDSGVISL